MSDLLAILRDRHRLLNLALIVPLVAANIILYGMLFVNAAEENWKATQIAYEEQ